MSSGPIRRAHLIAPFGVGSIVTVPNGTAMVAAGLDHWFEREGGEEDSRDIDLEEFRVEEWRLETLLHVNHFREPPDYRFNTPGERPPNTKLTIPFLRFPRWHFCWRCYRLTELELATRGKQRCQYCATDNKIAYLTQVPFIAMCEDGHLQDFPWREWVHRSSRPSCSKPITLRSTGGVTLANQIVECECGTPKRTLGRIVEAEPDGSSTYLSSALEKNAPYLCQGVSPQHGTTEPQGCSRPIRGSLRSASNVYFGVVKSAIYLPRTTESVPEELVSILEAPAVRTLIHLLAQAGQQVEVSMLRDNQRELLGPFSDTQIDEAVRLLTSAEANPEPEDAPASSDESRELAFRRDEYRVMRSGIEEDQLSVKVARLDQYDSTITPFIEDILLIDRLRETRALTGFNRIYPERGATEEERLRQLWRSVPDWPRRWLPAYKVFGEGIFLELNLERVAAWEGKEESVARARSVEDRYGAAQMDHRLQDRDLNPRFLLVHTFAHLLINQLTFECGYSTAALRERLYVSDSQAAPMAGVLIYTAAGDAEGTMGGLVRMGKPGYLEPAIIAALRGAMWCSADPVCMESGTSWGQGPDSCNLAACHNCALVPETACEEFNRFLDRGVVGGTLEHRDIGFFDLSQ